MTLSSSYFQGFREGKEGGGELSSPPTPPHQRWKYIGINNLTFVIYNKYKIFKTNLCYKTLQDVFPSWLSRLAV